MQYFTQEDGTVMLDPDVKVSCPTKFDLENDDIGA
jgi:hypothetical protein